MRSINLSASSIKDFMLCSKRYYYRINYPEASIQTASMKTGTVVHNVIEKALNSTYETVFAIGEQALKSLNLSEKEYKVGANKLDLSIKNYYNFFTELTAEDDLIEQNFKILFDNNVYLVGRIDRLSVRRRMVIDWKTNYKDPLFIDNDVQFQLYKYAYTSLYKEKPLSVLYANLFTGRLISLRDSDETWYIHLLESLIPSIVYKIKNNEFAREGIEKNICKHCQYNEKCFRDATEE